MNVPQRQQERAKEAVTALNSTYMPCLAFLLLSLLRPPLNFCFSHWKLPRCDFDHKKTYLFETRGKNYSDFWKRKHKTFGEDQTKTMWKVITPHFSTAGEMCWGQKVKHSLARASVEPVSACSGDGKLGLGWIFGNSACADCDGGGRGWWRRGRGRSGCSHRNLGQEETSGVVGSCPGSHNPPNPVDSVVNPASSTSCSATLA